MKFSNRWKAILGGLGAAAAITGGVLSKGGGSKPAPAPEPIAMWTATCEDVWRVELRREIDASGLAGCLEQARRGGTKDSIVATVRRSAEYAEVQARPVEVPTPEPVAVSLPPLTTDGPIFLSGGRPWRFAGITAFELLERYAKGEDIGPFLDDFTGFNVLRVFLYTPVKDWGAAAWDVPSPEQVIAFLKFVESRGFYVELVLLTDDDAGRIEPARRLVEALKAARPPNVILEAGNEPETHKAINTAALRSTLMASGFLVSSGNYEDSRHWYGHWIGFHSGRDAEWPRRAHDALDYNHGGGPNFPEEPALKVPAVCDEPIRPDQAGFNEADFRAYFGACSLLGAGGTYHFESGKYGKRPTGDEKRIAAVVLEALNHFPADAPKGRYERIDEQGATLRTYRVGGLTVRIRPTDGKVFP